jgi:hypothetical protein
MYAALDVLYLRRTEVMKNFLLPFNAFSLFQEVRGVASIYSTQKPVPEM